MWFVLIIAIIVIAGWIFLATRQDPSIAPKSASHTQANDAWDPRVPANSYDSPYATSSDIAFASQGYCQSEATDTQAEACAPEAQDCSDADADDGDDGGSDSDSDSSSD
jgi:hypothetical protein